MSDENIQVILHRLDAMDKRLQDIQAEVRKTNGRVTALEIDEARDQGKVEARRIYVNIISTAASGAILATIMWFVAEAVR